MNCGMIKNLAIKNATVTVTEETSLAGGGFGGTIDNCTASGTVKATGNEPVGPGGIGGCLEMMDSITNCSATVTIESPNVGHAVGGLCGYAGTHSDSDVCLETEGFSTSNYPCIIDNCMVDVKINVTGGTHAGGLIGTDLYYYGEETAFAITNCNPFLYCFLRRGKGGTSDG